MSRHHNRTPSSSKRASSGAVTSPDRRERDREAVERVLEQAAFDQAVTRLVAERRTAAVGGQIRTAEPVDPEPIQTTVSVAGMTCRSCEVRIAKFVGRLPGVEQVKASAVHGRVVIESSVAIKPAAIERAINAAGYELGRTAWFERDPKIWATAATGILLVVGLAVAAQVSGLAGLAAGAGDLSQGGLIVALLLGLAAGVSTCMALVGGLILALSASYKTRRVSSGAETAQLGAQMRPAVVFMIGRIAGYAVFGAALGAIGASLTLPPQVTATMMITVAVVMTLLGTRLTGLSPRVATWSPTLPIGLAHRLGLGDGADGGYSDTRAAGLGAVSFFLPCGFTQAVQIYALSTGSPLFAGALLATFAIGTAPGLLALAGLPLIVPSTARPTLLRLVGVLVIGFALVNASAGIRLAGLTLPSFGIESVAAAVPSGTVTDGVQSLHTYQDVDGYRPGSVAIYAGIPTRWTIESTNSATCASFIRVPSLGLAGALHKGLNTVDLPAMTAGTVVKYTCSMGMYDGQITVVDRPTGMLEP